MVEEGGMVCVKQEGGREEEEEKKGERVFNLSL